MDCVGMSSEILKLDADEVALNCSNRRSRYLPIESPRFELDTGCNRDRRVDGGELELANRPAVLLVNALRNVLPSTSARIERRQKLVRIEVGILVLLDRTEVSVLVVIVTLRWDGARTRTTETECGTAGDTESTEYRPSTNARIPTKGLNEPFFELFCHFSRGIVLY